MLKQKEERLLYDEEKIMLFAQLVSEIDISRYKQKEYVNIVKAIYWEIFGEKA